MKKGFTIVELMICLSIIGIIISVAATIWIECKKSEYEIVEAVKPEKESPISTDRYTNESKY